MTRLRQERLRLGYSQLDLGYRARIQPSEISRIETGRLRPYPAQLRRLSEALGVDPSVLIEDSAPEPVLA